MSPKRHRGADPRDRDRFAPEQLPSLRRAAILAMRDAAALIIMQMDKATKISALANGPIDPLDAVPGELQADADTEPDAEEAEEDFSLFAIGGIDDDGF